MMFCFDYQIKIKMKYILEILLLSLACAQPNYQERIIYYSHQDYACVSILSTDYIDLTINFNGTTLKSFNASGNTDCDNMQIIPQKIIRPRDSWSYMTRVDQISFKQETKYETFAGLLVNIIQKSTVINPINFEGSQYNCTIFGDGTKQHFGINPSPKIFMKCDWIGTSRNKIIVQ